MQARKKVVQGGTSAGKTYGIIPILIDKAARDERLKITVVAETLPAVKEGACDIFKTVMYDTNRWIPENWNASSLTYTFSSTRTRVQFKSFDSVGKAKASGKRDVLFLNEANHIPFPIADALMIRSKETWIDFNPDNKFWVHNETLNEPNSEFLLLTYHDNEALPKETLEDLQIKINKAFHNPSKDWKDKDNVKSNYWANWCYVYILGEIGNLDGVVFENWKEIDSLPPNARLLGYGLDFGYTNDPTAAIAVYKYNDSIILDEVIYQKKLSNSQIATLLKQERKAYVVADSAEPKSIAEIKQHGVKIIPTSKGSDSINFGISLLQEKNILITKRSSNLIEEFQKYTWAKDKNGDTMNKPVDIYNHGIDAVRYFSMQFLTQKKNSIKVRA